MSSATFSSICFDHGYPWMVSKTKKQNTERPVVKCSLNSKTQKTEKGMRIGVLGASGYTGSEIVRLLANHPYFGITLMTADRKAGQSIGSYLPNMVAIKDADFSDIDVVFCCLPHGTIQEEALYGLTKILREEITQARLVANLGCCSTSIQLPLVPLIKILLNPFYLSGSRIASSHFDTNVRALARKYLL